MSEIAGKNPKGGLRSWLGILILLFVSSACIEVEGSQPGQTPSSPTESTLIETQPVETIRVGTPVPTSIATPGAEGTPPSKIVFNRLEEILEREGAQVRIGERVEQDYIRTATRILEVDGEKVLVFAFPNERAAQAAMQEISEDGRTIAGREVNFRTTPWYFMEDRFILLTVSEDEALLDLLEQALGEPFAGEEPELQRPDGFVIETGEDVYHAFLYEGAQVEVGSNLQAPVETEEAFYLVVEGEEVQVFQMSTREEAEQVAGAISSDGSTIGIIPIPADATPHFFLVGRVIVFYQGDTPELLELLVEVLGEPITDHI